MCRCNPNYAGDKCQGELVTLPMDYAYSGSVPAGGWLYMKVNFPGVPYDRLRSVIDIEFYRTGGQPFVLVRSQRASEASDPPVMPTPLSTGNDMIMTMGSTETKRHYVIDAYADASSASVTSGVNYIAVFNMDYFVRGTCNFTIQISQSMPPSASPIINPSFMSIIMGVILSMFLCLVMSVCKRYGARWCGGRGCVCSISRRICVADAVRPTLPRDPLTKTAAFISRLPPQAVPPPPPGGVGRDRPGPGGAPRPAGDAAAAAAAARPGRRHRAVVPRRRVHGGPHAEGGRAVRCVPCGLRGDVLHPQAAPLRALLPRQLHRRVA